MPNEGPHLFYAQGHVLQKDQPFAICQPRPRPQNTQTLHPTPSCMLNAAYCKTPTLLPMSPPSPRPLYTQSLHPAQPLTVCSRKHVMLPLGPCFETQSFIPINIQWAEAHPLLHLNGRGWNVLVQNGPSINPTPKGNPSPSGVDLSFSHSFQALNPELIQTNPKQIATTGNQSYNEWKLGHGQIRCLSSACHQLTKAPSPTCQ